MSEVIEIDDDNVSRAFWDEKADENALWYVASDLDYASPDAQTFWSSGERDISEVLAEAGIAGGRAALDIGCGVGRLCNALASRFTEVLGCDVSPKMIELARTNLTHRPNVRFAVAAGDGSIPAPDGAFDLVLSLQVFQHIPDRRASLRYVTDAGRVLEPGGRFVFQLRTLRSSGRVLGTLERGVRAVVDRIRRLRKPPAPEQDSVAWRGSRPGLWEIRRALAAGGLVLERRRVIARQGSSVILFGSKPR